MQQEGRQVDGRQTSIGGHSRAGSRSPWGTRLHEAGILVEEAVCHRADVRHRDPGDSRVGKGLRTGRAEAGSHPWGHDGVATDIFHGPRSIRAGGYAHGSRLCNLRAGGYSLEVGLVAHTHPPGGGGDDQEIGIGLGTHGVGRVGYWPHR